MKNPRPGQLAFYAAVIIALVTAAGLLIEYYATGQVLAWWIPVILPLAVLIISYVVFFLFLKVFIYRKVKLIYKYIHETKTGRNPGEKPDLRMPDINTVEAEVKEWASSKREELQQLRDTARFRREFIGNVSHELKTPIFNMQGYLESLLDGGLQDEKVNRDFLRKALKNLNRIDRIVKDLEVISQLEAGALEPRKVRFNITKLTREVFELLEYQARSGQIQLEIKEGCDQPFWVMADPDLIRQVLVNLIMNSINYATPGEPGLTRVGFYEMHDYILVEVSDQGIGIAQEHLPRLFERFYRTDSARSRKVGGTGLGLAIVKHIVEAHGQTVHVRSSEGVGSTFGFTLQKA